MATIYWLLGSITLGTRILLCIAYLIEFIKSPFRSKLIKKAANHVVALLKFTACLLVF